MLNQRVVWSDNGTLKDLSDLFGSFTDSEFVIDLVAAQDAIYIGSMLPFNHRYIQVGSVVNAVASTLSVSLWNGADWVAAVDIFDRTRDSASRTKSLGQSGVVSWSISDNDNWIKDDTEDMTASGISTLKIFDLYWLKLTWSVDWTGTTALKYIGHKFATDSDLGVLYPQLNTASARAKFNNGTSTSNWDNQLIAASDDVIQELKNRTGDRLYSADQLIRFELLKNACVHKCAELIYSGFGDDFEDDRLRAYKYFEQSLKSNVNQFDQDRDLKLSESEAFKSKGRIVRE